jgi:hypothetical protein
MKQPNYKRLITTDFEQDDQALVEQLGESLNPGIESLYQALNKRLTISDNFQATEKDVIVNVMTDGTPRTETFVTTDFTGQVRNVFIGKLENLTLTGSYPTAAPFLFWVNTPTGIQIVNITSLTPGNNYKLRLVMFG